MVAPGVMLSYTNTLLKVLPPGRRNTYTGIFTMFTSAGAFVAPLIGVALSRQIGLASTLVLLGLLWIVLSSGFSLWPVRVPDTPQSVKAQ